MRARFPNMPLALALLAGAVVTTVAFAGFHRVVSRQISEGYPPPYPIPALMADKTNEAIAEATASRSAPRSIAAVAVNGLEVTKADRPTLIPPPPRGTRGPSQLIRTANLNLEVTDVTKALRTATAITDEQLGDVIGLNDENPATQDAAHTATMEIRVPQYRFQQTLDALGQLGKLKAKSVNAQDVSDQIVDAQARLRNLRRTEADILNIMDRSGNIEQVLNVTQQLGSVREQIERLDAQIQGMQYQVAYSTINISFTSPAVVSAPTGFDLLGAAWKSAIGSLRDFTVYLLSLGLWLLAFSPYALVIALLAALALRRARSHALPTRGA